MSDDDGIGESDAAPPPPERPTHPPASGEGPSIAVEEEMKRSYLDYAMSVIVARALPDLRDGLKPVHRRILYAMNETGNTQDKPYRKSARPVGDVMGKYHPHGDSAIYDALVRMAQPWSMSLPLLDGQGNFGSMDGDNPAAMRYTEVRMAKPADFLLADIDRDTVDFQDNYDGKDREPAVLPARFPNLLVNGGAGIAVGMATNIPPHNLGEVIDATLALIENPEMTLAEVMEHVPGPDFPTGGLILGRSGARRAYAEGRGPVVLRAKTRVETIRKDRSAIVVDEIPFQVNKAAMIEKIAEQVREKKIDGIAHVQDESDRFGVRVVIELKRDATPDVVLNQLYRRTQLQTSFGCNMLALNHGRPEQLDLISILRAFIDFREEVVARRTAHLLSKARERAHVLCGLAVAVENVDEVVRTIRSSPDPATARDRLKEPGWPAAQIADYIRLIDDPDHRINADGTYNLSDVQARAILDLRLQRLTAMGVKEIGDELQTLAAGIADYLEILRSRERILGIVSDELREAKEVFAVARRSEIVEYEGDFEDEDLIEREDMVVTVTHQGYIKRTPLTEFREQKRGGKGLQGMSTKDEDFVTRLFVANTHARLLFFTTDGMVYRLKCWQLPSSGRNARGRFLRQVLESIREEASVAAVMPVDVPEEDWDKLQIVFATSAGSVRRNALSDFTNVMRNGKIAMKLPEGVSLVNARICNADDDCLLLTAMGRAIRFPATDVRVFAGRESTGVRGIRLAKGDRVVSMAVIRHFIASPEERAAYLKMRRAVAGAGEDDAEEDGEEDRAAAVALSQERYAEMSAAEDLILTVTAGGAGKLSSSHDYPVRGRGGQGVRAMDAAMRGGRLIACFPVEIHDQIMLATDAGQSIRCPVSGISFRSRSAGGVRVFNTAPGEEVASAAWVADPGDDDGE